MIHLACNTVTFKLKKKTLKIPILTFLYIENEEN